MPWWNSVTTPAGVMRPIPLPSGSVNQRLPSGPDVMSSGLAPGEMPWLNSVTAPVGVIRPIPAPSTNQRLPSGPRVMLSSKLFGLMPEPNSVTVTDMSVRSSSAVNRG